MSLFPGYKYSFSTTSDVMTVPQTSFTPSHPLTEIQLASQWISIRERELATLKLVSEGAISDVIFLHAPRMFSTCPSQHSAALSTCVPVPSCPAVSIVWLDFRGFRTGMSGWDDGRDRHGLLALLGRVVWTGNQHATRNKGSAERTKAHTLGEFLVAERLVAD